MIVDNDNFNIIDEIVRTVDESVWNDQYREGDTEEPEKVSFRRMQIDSILQRFAAEVIMAYDPNFRIGDDPLPG